MPTDNKQLVTDLFARIKDGNLDAFTALFADDATWLMPGKPERFASAGSYDKHRFRRVLERMHERTGSPLNIWIKSMIAEGDRVAVECESQADLKNGRKYRQLYHMAIECRDGKVANVREYLDTQHSYDVWYAE